MRKSLKVFLATVAMTVAFVTPVFATETNIDAEMNYINNHVATVGGQITSYLTTDDGCGKAAKLDHGTHAGVVDTQLLTWVVDEEVNYVKYLQGVVVNKQETERIKQQNVAALTDVVKVNATFKPQLDAAVVEYNAAVADRMASQAAIVDAQTRFSNFNFALMQKVLGGISNNIANDK